jgi:hypothetical protein
MKKLLFLLIVLSMSLNVFAKFKDDGKPSQGSQMIFTNLEYANFNEALPHAIKEVKDGEKLWMYVKLPNPIGSYAFSSSFTDNAGNAVETIGFTIITMTIENPNEPSIGYGEQNVFIKGGDKAEGGYIVKKSGNVYLKNIDAQKATEFKLCLSEYIPHKSSYTFLKAVAGKKSKAGKWQTLFILTGKDQERFLESEIISNVENGFPQYRKAWNAYEDIVVNGDIADNKLPPTGKFNDETLKKQIINEAKNMSITPEKVVFTEDAWLESVTNNASLPRQKQIHAYISYKKNGKCFYAMAETTKFLGASGSWGQPAVNIYAADTPIECK